MGQLFLRETHCSTDQADVGPEQLLQEEGICREVVDHLPAAWRPGRTGSGFGLSGRKRGCLHPLDGRVKMT